MIRLTLDTPIDFAFSPPLNELYNVSSPLFCADKFALTYRATKAAVVEVCEIGVRKRLLPRYIWPDPADQG